MQDLPHVCAWGYVRGRQTLPLNVCLHCFLVGMCGVAGALSCQAGRPAAS